MGTGHPRSQTRKPPPLVAHSKKLEAGLSSNSKKQNGPLRMRKSLLSLGRIWVIIPTIMENQLEKKMENEMETVII